MVAIDGSIQELERPLVAGSRPAEVASRSQNRPEVAHRGGQLRRIRAELRLLRAEDTTVERLGLIEIAPALDDRRQIVPGDGDLDVVLAQGVDEPVEHVPDLGFGLRRAAQAVEDRRVGAAIKQRRGIVCPGGRGANLDGSSRQWLRGGVVAAGVGEATEVVVQRGEVVRVGIREPHEDR